MRGHLQSYLRLATSTQACRRPNANIGKLDHFCASSNVCLTTQSVLPTDP